MERWQQAYEKGRAAFRKGYLGEAAFAFREAIGLNPDGVESHHDLGIALFQLGRFDSALASFQSAIDLNDRMRQAWLNGGNALCAMHRHAEAIGWYRRVIELDPVSLDGHYNLANAYKSLGQTSEAMRHYQRALDIDPRMPEAHNNIGTLLLGSGELEKAIGCFQRAIAFENNYVKAIYNLGLALNRMGRPGEAEEHVRRCLELQPDNGEALALLVSLLQQTCDWNTLASAGDYLDRLTKAQLTAGRRPSESPFLNFTRSTDPHTNLLIARAWSHWLQQQYAHRRPDWGFSKHHQSGERIKVGYLSQRFRNAATAHLASGIFGRHDRQRFEIYAYSWGPDDGSYYREKIENGVDHFVEVQTLSDIEAAERIHSDGIDILVDMMGWMHGHRMGIAALRPAPVQISYLGYPGTTGAPFIDYLIADRVIVAEEMRPNYSEKVIWMPDCYQPNDPETPMAPVILQRTSLGLPEQATVFCSFNTDYKIEAEMFTCWMRILRAVPGSVLWLIVRSDQARRNLCRHAKGQGIDPARLVFAAPLPKPEHLARMKTADIALDTLPVNGHTTTTDALLAGLPVITCQGAHFASRVAGSILKAIGMDELVADSLQDYERLAVSLAKDSDRLHGIAARLKSNRAVFPLFDIDRYVKHLEAAYDTIWQGYLDEMPQHHQNHQTQSHDLSECDGRA